MADEEKIESKKPDDLPGGEKPKKFNTKILMIGLPAFVVQLVVVYFITANLLIDKIPKAAASTQNIPNSVQPKDTTSEHKGASEIGKFIFQIEDVIVNPADTEGKRLILASIGFDVAEEQEMQEYKSKEVLLKDVIVTTISSKNLLQLSNAQYKDSIKAEIYSRVKTLIPDTKLNTIYISKYIIQ